MPEHTASLPLAAFERLSAEHGDALRDFWHVYEDAYDELQQETMELARGHAEFGPLLAAMTPEQLEQQNIASRARLERGLVHGDWAEYVAATRAQGPMYAQLGISYSSWYEIIRLFHRALVPRIMKAFQGDPDRLSRVIVAKTEFLDLGMSLIAEQYLGAKQEERFRELVGALVEGILTVDARGIVTYANAGAETIFARKTVELAGVPVTTLVPEGFLEGLGTTVELVGLRKDGSEFPLEVSLTKWRSHDEDVYAAVVRDITERRAAQEKIRRAQEAAEAARLELESFSYSVAHDLRAPLRGIDGFSRALLEDVGPLLDGDAKHYLHRICAAAKRMDEIIDALLVLSRVSRTSVERQQVDLGDIARAVADQLRSIEPGRAVEFSTEPGLSAHGDPRLVRVMLENLLGNAWKFTRPRALAHVTLGVERTEREARYFVRDDGAGFDMTYADKLFGPFQRLHHAAEFPGTGIGLATVDRIVRMHGGRIWAEGAVGQGATFRFTLPTEPTSERSAS